MRLESIQIKNFHSIEDITLTFPDKGIVVIDGINNDIDGGSNGSGKSSLISAIPFALYGRSIKGLTLADCIRHGAEDLEIFFTFYVKDKKYRLKRTTKDLQIYENGKLLSGGKRGLQDFLNTKIGLTFSAFKSLFLGQDWSSFVEVSPSERVNALADIFGVFYLDSIQKGIKEKLKRIEQKQKDLSIQISFIKGQINENLRSYEPEIKQWESKRKATLLAKYRKLRGLEEEWDEIKEVFEKSEREKQDGSLKEIEDQIKVLEDQILALVSKIQDKKYKVLDLNKENERLVIEIKKHKEKQNLFASGVCPTCGQEIRDKDKFFGHITKEVNRLKKEIWENEERIKVLNQEILELEQKLRNKEAKKNLLLKKQKEIISLETKALSLSKEKERLLNHIEQIKKEIELLKAEENPYVELENKRKAKLNKLTHQLNKYNSLLSEIKEEAVYLEIWQDIVKYAKHELFLLMLKELEDRVNAFLDFFSLDFDLAFVLNNQRLDIEIIRGGIKFPFKALSGGEFQLVKLSCLLGLYEMVKVRIGESIKFICFDEPLQHLDQNKRAKFFELIRIFAQDMLVFIIDHHQDIGSDYDMLILIEKTNGITRLNKIAVS